MSNTTPFGFTWGPMEVLRAYSDKRFRVPYYAAWR